MVAALKPILKYQETFVPGKWNAIATLQTLLQAGIFSSYVMYEKEGEIRIAGNEIARVSVSQDSVRLTGLGTSRSERAIDPFKQVGELLGTLSIRDWTAYGYVSFDMAGFYSSYSKAIQQPLLCFFIPAIELCFHSNGVHIKCDNFPLERIRDLLSADSEVWNPSPAPLSADFEDCDRYSGQIETLIEAIQNDELHKAIISRSRKLTGKLDVLATYAAGATVNNSARSYCFDLGEVCAVGFSPEILMEVHGDGIVVTNPLAATRPRGQSNEEDARLMAELFTDAKEVKEHALSIWLAQDEIDSLCVPETVRIFNFMEVKKYRCVQHLSSRVGGQLKPGNTLWDALKVLFPGITVAGINKQQALAWIERLEEEPRGVYAGGIGWVDSHGRADLAIAIRSVYQYGDEIRLNAGAGIVAESVPRNEYIESVNKMNTMLTNLVLES